jgi:hypothetical protein
MTDETAKVAALVKRWDEYSKIAGVLSPLGIGKVIGNEMRDRIEALTAQLAEDADGRKQIDHRLEELVGQVDALTALVREADDLIGGDLTGLQWKRECREFRVKARRALTGKADT